ncbi:hypothetical protein [Bryobacter aggregatus]|uniref:hypothetical protein n=1 Tax=Bryobacter aggregatus TaxID=360054 RepID=UPI0004E0E22F|nr:hypothetical protein [Bryobacter aggregatus]
MWPSDRTVWWDTEQFPDYTKFVVAAKTNGTKMMLYFDQELTPEEMADAEVSLEAANFEPEEFRDYSRRVAEMRSYVGFTSRLGLGFTSEGLFYWYELEAPWYQEFLSLIEDLQMAGITYGDDLDEIDDDDDKDPPMGNFYSNN